MRNGRVGFPALIAFLLAVAVASSAFAWDDLPAGSNEAVSSSYTLMNGSSPLPSLPEGRNEAVSPSYTLMNGALPSPDLPKGQNEAATPFYTVKNQFEPPLSIWNEAVSPMYTVQNFGTAPPGGLPAGRNEAFTPFYTLLNGLLAPPNLPDGRNEAVTPLYFVKNQPMPKVIISTAGFIAEQSGGLTASSTPVEICWSSADISTPTNELVYSYRSDSGDWSEWSASTCHSFPLNDSLHTIAVRAKDLSANQDLTPAALTFNVDASAPLLSDIMDSPAMGSAIIAWTTDEQSDSRVQYGLTDSYGLESQSSSPVTNHAVEISGLTPGTVYHYRVRSNDSYGHEAVSCDFLFRTIQDITPPQISFTSKLIDGSTVCNRDVSVCWTGTDDITPSADIQYSYALDQGEWSPWSTETCHTFAGLTDGSHSLILKSKDSAGNVNSTAIVLNFNVDATIPSLSDIRVAPSDSRATISWNSSKPATFQVEYGETQAYGFSSRHFNAIAGAQSFTIEPLNPQTTYHFRIKCNDECREFSSQDGTFNTAPAPLSNLRIAQIDMRGTTRSLEQSDLQYLVRNNGSGSAEGNWTDKVYLSTDATLDAQDTLLGEFAFSGPLEPATERWQKATISMPMMAAGSYFIIMEADAGNVISESNENDNSIAKQIDYLMIKQLTAAPDQIPIRLDPGQTANGEIDLINLGDTALTAITAVVEGNSSNISVQAVPPSSLSALSVQKASYSVAATNDSVLQNSPVLKFTSAEGKETSVTFNVTVKPRYPKLVTNPGYLEAGMVRGSQSVLEFEITNTGAVSANDLKILLPEADWLSLVTPDTVESLAPGAKTKVTLALKPALTLPLGPYTGNISLSASNANASISFRITAVSDNVGGLKISAQDEFTYYAENHPPLVDASVKIKNPYDGTLVAEGKTDSNGQFTKSELPEGYYIIDVSADKHAPYNASVRIAPGQTKEIDAFLSRQLVSYTWKVTPVLTEDKYTVNLDATFETNVPAPVITVDPMVLDLSKLSFDENGRATVNYTITNHGLIGVSAANLHFGTHPDYQMIPLNEKIGNIPAMSTLIVPVTVNKVSMQSKKAMLKSAGLRILALEYPANSSCSIENYLAWLTGCEKSPSGQLNFSAVAGECSSSSMTTLNPTGGNGSSPGSSGPPPVQQDVPCDSCKCTSTGHLSGGTVKAYVDNNQVDTFAVAGKDITFTADGVTDSGGGKNDCSVGTSDPVPSGSIKYRYEIIDPSGNKIKEGSIQDATPAIAIRPDEPGDYTARFYASVERECKPTELKLKEKTITVIKIKFIDIVSGATAIKDGMATPKDTDVCAAIKDTGDILLQANLDPNIPEADLPSGFIEWTGGGPVEGHPLQRKVSKSQWSKTEVKVSISGKLFYTMITYVIGAEPTGTKRDGTSSKNNSLANSIPLYTGMHGPIGANGWYQSVIEIEFSIKPSDLFKDGVGSLFEKKDIQWDVTREKKTKYWMRVSGTWLLDIGGSLSGIFDEWADDDISNTEEDNDPWDGEGYIYATDVPGWEGQGDWLVSKLNMRESVRVGLGGTSGENGTKCSDYQYWHAFRSIRQSPPVWVNDQTYGNELENGTVFWGSVPPVP